MPRKTATIVTILATSLTLAACSFFQEKTEKQAEPGPDESSAITQLLPGTWKLMAVKCDSTGNNCEQYAASRMFEYSAGGEFTVNGTVRGTYRLENRDCILDTGTKQYTVSIVQIGPYRMVTGEPGRNTTEVFNKIK